MTPSAATNALRLGGPRAGAQGLHRIDQHARRIVLRRLPAIVEVAVVGHQELQVARPRRLDRQVDGRREAAQQRRHRPRGHIAEAEGLACAW